MTSNASGAYHSLFDQDPNPTLHSEEMDMAAVCLGDISSLMAKAAWLNCI